MNVKRLISIMLCVLLVFLTGCWDSLEINERLFITAIGVDLNTDPEAKGRYSVTYVYPNVGALGKNPSQKEVKSVITTTAETPYEASRQITTRTSNPFFFKHLKVIVIGEGLFKRPELIREYFDGLAREYAVNRKIGIIVAEGSAKDVVSTKVDELAIIGGYLNSMLKNNKNAQRFTDQTFSQIIKDHYFSNASFAPRAIPKAKEYKISGAAIIKDYKLVGWIGEKENRALSLIRDHLKSEIFNAKYKDATIDYVISQHKSNKKVSKESDKLSVDLNIFLEGYIEQYKLGEKIDTFNRDFIDTVESKIEDVVTEEIKGLVNKLQSEYNADVIGIGEYLCKFKPDIWDDVKDQWDEVFPNIDINVNVVVRIRRTGLTK